MKLYAFIGLVLIAFGIIALVFNGIPYHREKGDLDVGPIHAKIQAQKELPLPRLLGIGSAIAG